MLAVVLLGHTDWFTTVDCSLKLYFKGIKYYSTKQFVNESAGNDLFQCLLNINMRSNFNHSATSLFERMITLESASAFFSEK